MGHSKTPGQNNAASDTFLKKQAQAQGLGAENASAHKEPHAPGEAPVASDSGATDVGIDSNSTSVPGTKGLKDVPNGPKQVRPLIDSGTRDSLLGVRLRRGNGPSAHSASIQRDPPKTCPTFKMKLIVAGATGFLGSEVVRQALRLEQVSSVIALARKPLKLEDGIDTSKLKNVTIKDYAEYSEGVKKEFTGADACIWTVAITPGKSRQFPFDEVKRVCQESTLAGMKAMHEAGLNQPFRFIYLSGAMAERDQTKRPLYMADYSLMRAQTETMVIDFAAQHGFEGAAAKPGLISTDKTIGSSVVGAILRATGIFPGIRVEELSAALLQSAFDGFEKEPLTNEDMVRIGRATLQAQKE
ncbi:hypothetical protein SCUP515_12563 [Seiridium cupressi]